MPVEPGRPDADRHLAAQAACLHLHPDALSVQGPAQARAKAICACCPIRVECLAEALDNRMEYGVWGGMTAPERRALLRRRTDVTSWASLLAPIAHRH